MRRYGGIRYGERRPTVVVKAENAVGRADQLILVGQKERALQALYDLITDNSNRKRVWSKAYESIMIKLLELCVELRRASMIKEALHKYRALCAQAGAQSLEDVSRKLIDLAEAKTEEARKLVADSFSLVTDAEDLDSIGMETAETLLMEAAGKELSKDRVDRQQVVPWMRFMWEIYRTVLDIVKSSARLEVCYHDVAVKAFTFCTKYSRFLEFRRLCDMLRQHLAMLLKAPKSSRNSANDIQLSAPETMQRFLDMRFLQLDTAVALANWGEAQRTIDDIHLLITLSKKTPRAQTMAKYYELLTEVFWVNKNVLFHACALSKLHNLQVKQNKNLSEEDAALLATKLLLSVLIIPAFDSQIALLSERGEMTLGSGGVLVGAGEENSGRLKRTAALLGYTSGPPQRSQLLEELVSRDVPSICMEPLRDLYTVLESEMSPTSMAKKLNPMFEFIESHEKLKGYASGLRRIAGYRLLGQLSKVYSVIRINKLEKLASFSTIQELEQIALESLKTRSMFVRIDHQAGCLRFDSSMSFSDSVKVQLGTLGRRLIHATKMIAESKYTSDANAKALVDDVAAKNRLATTMKLAKIRAETEHRAILARKEIIERRKEEQEQAMLEAEREAKRRAEEERLRKEAEERKRNEEELRRRELERRKREIELREQAELRALKAEIEAKRMADKRPASALPVGADLIIDDEADKRANGQEQETLDREALLTKKHEDELRAKREQEKKYQQLVKRLDYTRRAMYEVNRPLVKENFQKSIQERVAEAEKAHRQTVEDAKKQFEKDSAEKARTSRMLADLSSIRAQLISQVDSQFEIWLQKESTKRAEDARRAEEARRREEEDERRRREEKERKEAEAALEEEQRIKDEEAKRRLEAGAREERARVEEKLRAKNAGAGGDGDGSAVGTGEKPKGAYVPPSVRAAQSVSGGAAGAGPSSRQDSRLDGDARFKGPGGSRGFDRDERDRDGGRRGFDRRPGDRGPGDRGPAPGPSSKPGADSAARPRFVNSKKQDGQ